MAVTETRAGFETPEPAYPAEPLPLAVRLSDPKPVAPMVHHEKMRMRAAAFRATRVYPGPVGELISRELLAWEDFGYVLSNGGLVLRLVDHVMKTELPT